MANNKMYLKNTRTGDKVYLAKYYPSTGWYVVLSPEKLVTELDEAFDRADFGHLDGDEKLKNAIKIGFGSPYAFGGMYGAEWVIEYDEDGK